jgi:hypothetical protein
MRYGKTAASVIVYAIAMAYVESAVVVYFQRALAVDPNQFFPLHAGSAANYLATIEVGREFATMVMLAMIGTLAGRRWQDRLAWSAVAFGVWDLFYYLWLWVFIGWPGAVSAWDVLFLIPAPWAGPVWAPGVVSLALVTVGLITAYKADHGYVARVSLRTAAAGLLGGLLVVASFLANAPALMHGHLPGWFPWPIFLAGMAIAAISTVSALGGAGRSGRARG